MLSTLIRKLCPLMTLAVATIGCGKKIANPDSEAANNTQNSETPSAYILRLDTTQASSKLFISPGDANFYMPTKLNVRSGSASGKEIQISYEVNEYDNDDFAYRCYYVPSLNPSEMKLNYCQNYLNQDLGDVSSYKFLIKKDYITEMKVIGSPTSDLVVETIYTMEWF
jgi:hypothetical protein